MGRVKQESVDGRSMLDNPSSLGSCALAAAKREKVAEQGQAVTAVVVLCLPDRHSPVASVEYQATTRAVTYRWRRSVAQLLIPADDGLLSFVGIVMSCDSTNRTNRTVPDSHTSSGT